MRHSKRREWASLFREIRGDHRAGASALLGRAIEASRLFLAATRGLDSTQLKRFLIRFTQCLTTSQPSMAPFLTLANAMWRTAERSAGLTWEALHAAIVAYADGLDRHLLRTVRYGSRLIRRDQLILTYSHSTAVRMALLKALAAGRRFSVACSESRPMCEGTALARRLAAAGIPVYLTTDAALVGWIERADLVLVGADAVMGDGIVNKVGTEPLLQAARRGGVPAYILADSSKWLPTRLAPYWEMREERAGEVARTSNVNLSVQNAYFDRTPYRLITGIVWEGGIAASSEVRRRLAGLPTSKDLVALLQRQAKTL